jgi:uncharacterized protein YkwD
MKKLLLLFALVPSFSCTKTAITQENSELPVADVIVNNVNSTIMLKLVNDLRVGGCNCGTTKMPPVGKLVWNDTLSKTAYLHSADMSGNNYFSHTGLDGKQPWDRLTQQGFKWTATGENIAQGQPSDSLVMSAWLGSEPHCKNIMDGRFRVMGAGMKNRYWTQLFAR